jgi:hypothetical protein
LSAATGTNQFIRKDESGAASRMMHTAWPGATFGGMQAVGRLAVRDPGIVVDAGLAIAAAGLTAVAVGGSPRLIGSEAVAGPSWLLALLPLLMGVPLVLRRRAPLLMWLAIWAGIALLFLFASDTLRGLAWTFVLFAAAYALGAHASLRRAVAGVVLTAPVVAVISYKGELGLALGSGGDGGNQATVVLTFLQLLAVWLAGVFVHARRRAASLAARSAALQRQAEQAAAAERARIAWDRPWRGSRTADGRRWPRPATCLASCATLTRRPGSPRSQASAT